MFGVKFMLVEDSVESGGKLLRLQKSGKTGCDQESAGKT